MIRLVKCHFQGIGLLFTQTNLAARAESLECQALQLLEVTQ
jgi:hypothetical protein